MRFMIIRKADAETEAGVLPSQELIDAMTAFHEKAGKAGILLGGDGLKPSSKGARLRFSKGRPTVIDGPFTETKELVAGYTLIQVGSLEEAIEWVKGWPTADGHGEVEIEIRPLYEGEDFGEAYTDTLREREERMREEASQRAEKT